MMGPLGARLNSARNATTLNRDPNRPSWALPPIGPDANAAELPARQEEGCEPIKREGVSCGTIRRDVFAATAGRSFQRATLAQAVAQLPQEFLARRGLARHHKTGVGILLAGGHLADDKVAFWQSWYAREINFQVLLRNVVVYAIGQKCRRNL